MADGATVDEVRGIVRDELQPLEGAVVALGETSGDAQGTNEFLIDAQQWEHLSATFRLYATCDVIALLLMATLVGLVGFQHFTQGWRR